MLVEVDRRDLGRVQRPLDEQLRVGRIVHHVDVLVAQLLDDRVDARSLHADAGAYRVDAVVVGFYGDFGAFAGDADDLLDRDQAVVNFRDLHLEKPFEEFRGGTRQNDVGVVVLHLHFRNDRLDAVALAEEIVRDLFRFRQHQFVLFVVQHEYFLFPYLVDLSGNDFAHFFGIFVEQIGLFQVEYPRGEILPQRQHGAPSEVGQLDLFGHLFAHFVGRVDFAGVGQRDLLVRVFHRSVLHDRPVAPYFEVSLFRVDDHVEIFVRFVSLDQQVTKHIFQNTDHGALIDVLKLFELRERVYEIEIVHICNVKF